MAQAITLEAARGLVSTVPVGSAPVESVPLENALGRFLATDVCAEGPWPTTDRSAMDGFAVVAGAGLAAGTGLPVVGESLAGAPFAGALAAGQAIRIMTGAVVPPGADAVVPVEQTSGFGGAVVELRHAVAAGQNVRARGSEVAAGERLLAQGQRLGPAAIGALAVLGRMQVPVFRRPVVAIVATGDEVVPADRVPLPHQVRESNSWALAAQVQQCGAVAHRFGIAPDEPAALRGLLERGLAQADLLLTIGGVSKGTHDLVHGTLAELGVAAVFHGIDLKPGKPTFFGRRDAAVGARFVFGLPGNPASTFTVFDLLVRPLLRRLCGGRGPAAPVHVPLGRSSWRANARLQAVPARLVADADGALAAAMAPPSPSGDPFSLLHGDCYVLVPPGVRPGDVASLPAVAGSEGAELP